MAGKQEIFPVVIIGGGLAGLTAALHLAERGLTPLVLEADQLWAGGRLAGGDPETFEYGGQTWAFPTEHGMHALWGGYVNMRATLDRFLDIELVPSPGEMWINRWGRAVRRVEAGTAVRSRWLPAPFHYLQLLFRPRFWSTITPLDFLSLPGFLVSVLLTVGFDPLRERRPLDGLLMSEYFRGWTPNLKATFVGLGKNLLAAPAEEISLTGFIAALRFFTMLNRETWHPYFLPADANTALIAPMIAKLEELGGGIFYGATAKSLIRTESGWRIRIEDAKRGPRTAEAEQVILALDPPAAADLLGASPDTAPTASKLRIPRGIHTSTVRLWFTKTPKDAVVSGMFTGDFAFDNYFWLDQMQTPFRAWHAATGGSTIEMHLYATSKDNDQPDNLLILQGVNEVVRAFPELRGAFVHGAVRRNSKTQTIFRVPTDDCLGVRTPFPDVYACGDWINWETPSLWMERSCTTAIAAANQILAARNCEPYPLLDPSPPGVIARGLGQIVYGGRKVFGVPLRLLRRRGKRDS
ncbi:MAG: FAD-dependent oxidoreductase [Anaerolineae bacterium]|nr:FAD-dependent oxidoreductase [Anaerolineae bacterium]